MNSYRTGGNDEGSGFFSGDQWESTGESRILVVVVVVVVFVYYVVREPTPNAGMEFSPQCILRVSLTNYLQTELRVYDRNTAFLI